MEALAEKVRWFQNVAKLSELAKLLIQRFDPGNKEALAQLLADKVAEFAQLARPLVSVLLYYFIAGSDEEDEHNDVHSSDDEEDYDDHCDYGDGGALQLLRLRFRWLW
ncbi:hypothetical protein RvY_00350 [Ramazzottius varieornatus]|uniref:Uncharacterized protein n=1 Tax=Ramazzottius varieornatus TaxID=947166 RepID=A0A1D1UMY0_RAMVA|nr:hypothetical protein RvY_00350 [Ramazzottius varieornatus]